MSQHCSLEDLLALRDGEAPFAARRHLDECAACREEVDRLHQRQAALKALPALRPPRDRWPEVRAMAAAARRKRWWVGAGWSSLAAAAAVAALVGVRTLSHREPVAVGRLGLDSLVRESQKLEEALRLYDPTSRVLSGRAASTIAQLEDRIAVLDAQLAEAQRQGASPDELAGLWRQRVQLMGALVNVHVTRAAYVGL
jgi:hypothetical protein